MTLDRLVAHLEEWHDIYLDSGLSLDLDAYLESDHKWKQRLKRNPPDPLPCDYDSEKDKLISDDDSQSEEEIEEEKPSL